jgi:hypothetical protein
MSDDKIVCDKCCEIYKIFTPASVLKASNLHNRGPVLETYREMDF